MRFILKCAFWLGLVAFLVPFGDDRGETEARISWLGAFAGAQEAIEDFGGFCDRAPRACDAGREMAVFAGERIADGIAIAYDFVDGRRAPAIDTAHDPERAANTAPDPLLTGGVGDDGPLPPAPRAYVPPKRAEPAATPTPAHSTPAAVPTPTPRA